MEIEEILTNTDWLVLIIYFLKKNYKLFLNKIIFLNRNESVTQLKEIRNKLYPLLGIKQPVLKSSISVIREIKSEKKS